MSLKPDVAAKVAMALLRGESVGTVACLAGKRPSDLGDVLGDPLVRVARIALGKWATISEMELTRLLTAMQEKMQGTGVPMNHVMGGDGT